MNKADVIEFLIACSASDLIDVFTRATTGRSNNSAAEATHDIEYKLVLCHAWRYVGPLYDESKAWELEVVVNPTSDRIRDTLGGEGYSESGTCAKCNLPVVSYAKLAFCPLCGSEVGLT